MVGDPAYYRWSSDRANADGQHNPLLQPYPIDLALGANDAERPAAYRALFAIAIDTESPGSVRACLQTGTAFGNDRFRVRFQVRIPTQLAQAIGSMQTPRPCALGSALDTGARTTHTSPRLLPGKRRQAWLGGITSSIGRP